MKHKFISQGSNKIQPNFSTPEPTHASFNDMYNKGKYCTGNVTVPRKPTQQSFRTNYNLKLLLYILAGCLNYGLSVSRHSRQY
jgi:hypothetical protein